MGHLQKPNKATKALERALDEAERQEYVLRLYITGMTPRSMEALATIKQICETHLHGRYTLDVIDIYKNPSLAKDAQIVAVPTLIKQLPVPIRRFVGNLSDVERVLVGLDLQKKSL